MRSISRFFLARSKITVTELAKSTPLNITNCTMITPNKHIKLVPSLRSSRGLAVMRHVSSNQRVTRQGCHKTDFSSQSGGGYDMGELLGVLAGLFASSLDPYGFETCCLGWQSGTSANRPDLDAWHRAGRPKIAVRCLLHDSNAIRAFDILGRVCIGLDRGERAVL